MSPTARHRFVQSLVSLALALAQTLALALAMALAMALASMSAYAAPQPLTLAAADADIDTWPWVTMLHDTDGRLTLAQARAASARYIEPPPVHANLGPREGAVWLRLPFTTSATDRTPWWVDLGFTGVDRADVHLFESGVRVQQLQVGNDQTFAQRPLPTQHYVVPLSTQPGRSYELLVRFESSTALMVPMRLMRPEAYGQAESRRHLLQGTLSGVWVCLLLAALVYWASLRERMFLTFAFSVVGANLFYLTYFGFGPQHVWGSSTWLTKNLWVFAVFMTTGANAMFVHDALKVSLWFPWLARALRAVAWASVAAVAGFLVGAVDLRLAGQLGSAIGALPMLLGVAAAGVRVRSGDRAARLILVGWSAVFVGSLFLISLQRGWLPQADWAENAVQLASTVEMVLWMFVLAMHLADVRLRAEAERREHAHLHALAYRDPLTGLLNRRGLQLDLERGLLDAAPASPLALYLLDLDGFKAINDTLGHDAGDAVLVQVAARLQAQMRGDDIVARLGGDEFVVAVHHVADVAFAGALGQRLHEAFNEPFIVGGTTRRLGATIGYALAPHDGADMASLLKRADAAMYAGKQMGKNRVLRGSAGAGMAQPAAVG